MKSVYVLCYCEDIESKQLLRAFRGKRALNRYLKNNNITLRENNADIFKFYEVYNIGLEE